LSPILSLRAVKNYPTNRPKYLYSSLINSFGLVQLGTYVSFLSPIT
jgi:hypothetical protein